MNDLNSILIEGNIDNDAVLDKPQKDICVCTFTIASTRYCKFENGMKKKPVILKSRLLESWRRQAVTRLTRAGVCGLWAV
jgi:single-stranded DNA-binding protein